MISLLQPPFSDQLLPVGRDDHGGFVSATPKRIQARKVRTILTRGGGRWGSAGGFAAHRLKQANKIGLRGWKGKKFTAGFFRVAYAVLVAKEECA